MTGLTHVVRELLQVLQAAGLRHPQRGHFGHGRRRRLQLLPPVSPQPAPRQGGGGRDGAGRRQRRDVEEQHLAEATTTCADRYMRQTKGSRALWDWDYQRKKSEEQMLHRREPADIARPLAARTFGHGGCSAPERGNRDQMWMDGTN